MKSGNDGYEFLRVQISFLIRVLTLYFLTQKQKTVSPILEQFSIPSTVTFPCSASSHCTHRPQRVFLAAAPSTAKGRRLGSQCCQFSVMETCGRLHNTLDEALQIRQDPGNCSWQTLVLRGCASLSQQLQSVSPDLLWRIIAQSPKGKNAGEL